MVKERIGRDFIGGFLVSGYMFVPAIEFKQSKCAREQRTGAGLGDDVIFLVLVNALVSKRRLNSASVRKGKRPTSWD